MASREPSAAIERGWYLWDYDRSEIVRGPYPNSGVAAAVRTEMERHLDGDDDRNLWIVYWRTIKAWREEISRADA